MSPNPETPPPLLTIPRLTTLFASLFVSLCSGTTYTYSGFSPQLGARLHITHAQLNILGSAASTGVHSSGPIWGKMLDAQGPRLNLACSFVLLLAGYTGVRFIFNSGVQETTETISTLTFCILAICFYMTGAGGNGGFTAAMNSTARTFPDEARATTTGIVISGIGLSAFFFSTLSGLFFPGDTSSYLLLLSLGTAVPMIFGFFFIRSIPPEADPDPKLECGAEAGDRLSREREIETVDRDDSETSPLLSPAVPDKAVALNTHGAMLFWHPDFWLIFSILSIFTGTGLMYINNVGSMAQALYIKGAEIYDPVEAAQWQARQVSLISLMSFSGRLLTGFLSDFLKNKFALPRSYSMILVGLAFFTSQVLAIYVDTIQQLWMSSVMVGFSYGMTYTVFPMVCLEWFGITHFSENWGYLGLAPMIAPPIFSFGFGKNLDAHNTPESAVGSGLNPKMPLQCKLGRECYVSALYFTAAACFLAVLLSVRAASRDWRKTLGEMDESGKRADGEGGDVL